MSAMRQYHRLLPAAGSTCLQICLLLTLLLGCAARSSAEAATVYVPPSLEPWREWVLHGQEWRDCPMVFDGPADRREARFCAWPGVLALEITDSGALFRQSWTVRGDLRRVPLPGSEGTHWPERVEVDGRPGLVLSRDGRPFVELTEGRHFLTGVLRWSRRPGELAVPAPIGLIELVLDGQRVAAPQVDGGQLFLGQRPSTEVLRDSIRSRVYRLAVDSSPSRLTTLLRIDVSGGLREANFGPFLPEGFVPERLESELPARFEGNGQLRVQLRPGRWTLSLHARAAQVLNRFAPLVGGENMPDVEILSFQAMPGQRVSVPSGLPPVDPAQTQVPPRWRTYPAYEVAAGDALLLEERSRGVVDRQNRLVIRRSLWMDFDGRGMTAVDEIGGAMRRDWRLDMAAPFRLESAQVNGENLLVTFGANSEERGVELRREQVALRSVARTETAAVMPVTGWNTRFTSAELQLHLPPGRRLIAASGADAAAGAWLARWELLDIFLLLIVTAATARLFGPPLAVIAFAAVALSYHESGAPAGLWLNLLATVALLRVAPAGRLKSWLRGYFYLSLFALGVVLIPFLSEQVRVALYPQLERSAWSGAQSTGALQGPAVRAVPAPELVESGTALATDEVRESSEQPLLKRQRSQYALSAQNRRFERFAPNALVQTGPGVPAWQWQRYRLIWEGPVETGQTVRLVIAPPWLMTAWRLAAALFSALLATCFVAEALRRQWTLPGGLRVGAAPPVALLLALLLPPLSAGLPAMAQAGEIPDRELLEQLRRRLTEDPGCLPRCAEYLAGQIRVEPRSLEMRLDVHASVDVAMPIPGLGGDWRPRQILLDGEAVAGVGRDGDRLMVWVPAGQHQITLSGELPDKSSIELAFPERPRVIDTQVSGWSLSGVVDRRLVTGSLQLDRVRGASTETSETVNWESSRFPAFVTVLRRLELGLDWRVETTVRRVAPASGSLEVTIPLIDGETVISEASPLLEFFDGGAQIAMPSTVSSASWVSSLEPAGQLQLRAGDGSRWVETWEIAAGSIWHVDVEAVPESVDREQLAGARVARYHPRRGESLIITASRPGAVSGATTAIDAVQLETAVGRRLLESTLRFRYRATRGGQQYLDLPAGATVTNIEIDGQREALRPVDGVLTVPIRPGTHEVSLGFQEARQQSLLSQAPRVGLGSAASNINLRLNIADDRWLLFTWGPRLGPAVLYWSQLLFLIALALVLGRIPWTPLKARHWLLLALGFSSFSWPVLAIVVIWLLATGARERWTLKLKPQVYNAVQVFHALLTVLALLGIIASLPSGLLGAPDMFVVGNQSYATTLNWFADQTAGTTPRALFVSLPLWAYKALILLWALWLSFALLAWLPWVWQMWARDGLWRRETDARAPEEPAA